LILKDFLHGIGVAQLASNWEGKMKPANYIAVLTILNEMLRRVSESLPAIEQATRELRHELPADARVGK
jgi:hypothetical protein